MNLRALRNGYGNHTGIVHAHIYEDKNWCRPNAICIGVDRRAADHSWVGTAARRLAIGRVLSGGDLM